MVAGSALCFPNRMNRWLLAMNRSKPGVHLPLAGLLVLALWILPGCAPLRGYEALQLAKDIAAAGGPSGLKESRPAPRRRAVTYEVEQRVSAGDLYLPGDRAEAGLVLVPGAAVNGKDDPKFVAFAESLARGRFAVLVPEIPNLRQLKVRSTDARKIADAARHLAGFAEDGTGQGAPVGVVAVSYAVGPAVMAAAAPDAREQIRFVAAIGGYYDLEAVITFFTAGVFRTAPGEPWQAADPNPYGKWVFLRSNSDFISLPRDRRLLLEMAERKLRDLSSDIADLAAALSPEGRSVYALLQNRDPAEVARLISVLPSRVRAEIRALDLKNLDFSEVSAQILLVHGRDDQIIPYSESLALAAAAGEEGAELFLVDNLAHVDLGPGSLDDQLTLWRAAYRLLEERDAAPAPRFPQSEAGSAVLMAEAKKTYLPNLSEVKELVPGRGACIVTDRITVEGLPVRFMYREEPDNDIDSGWRFFSGHNETDDYVDNPENSAIFDVNTIANHDPSIIPYVDAPPGSVFEKVPGSGDFVPVEDWEPEEE